MSKNNLDLVPKLKAAQRAGTPIAAVNTPDQPATCSLLAKELNGDRPVFAWDFVRGIYAKNERGLQALAALGGEQVQQETAMNPLKVLDLARDLPAKTVLFYFNANRFTGDGAVCQALMNLRDPFKANQSMVVLLGLGITMPPEIATDVVQWTEPLPDDAKLLEIVSEIVESNAEQLKSKPSKDQVVKAATALRGCSAFGAEQLAAMSLRKEGIDMDTLHTQAKAIIETTPGLTFERGGETFDDIGGLEFAKEFGRRMFKGPKAPAVIVRVEELEKAMAGSKGDLSGTSGDALQVLLSSMEDNNWSGMLAYGCPGAGKSLFAKSLANTHGAKALTFDINSCKGSLVGQSEQQIRRAMQVIHTIGGANVFFVASCNAMDSLPAALQRRFRSGVWMFDAPSEQERADIWALNRKKYQINPDEPSPDEADLTGADIRNICEQAYMLQCSLAEARRYVVPLKVQSPHDLENVRKLARGKFLDSAKGGVYGAEQLAPKQAGSRKVRVE